MLQTHKAGVLWYGFYGFRIFFPRMASVTTLCAIDSKNFFCIFIRHTWARCKSCRVLFSPKHRSLPATTSRHQLDCIRTKRNYFCFDKRRERGKLDYWLSFNYWNPAQRKLSRSMQLFPEKIMCFHFARKRRHIFQKIYDNDKFVYLHSRVKSLGKDFLEKFGMGRGGGS